MPWQYPTSGLYTLYADSTRPSSAKPSPQPSAAAALRLYLHTHHHDFKGTCRQQTGQETKRHASEMVRVCACGRGGGEGGGVLTVRVQETFGQRPCKFQRQKATQGPLARGTCTRCHGVRFTGDDVMRTTGMFCQQLHCQAPSRDCGMLEKIGCEKGCLHTCREEPATRRLSGETGYHP
jgi:hypothetical protein